MKKAVIISVVILLILLVVSLIFFRQKSFNYSGVAEAVEVGVPARLNQVLSKLHAKEGDMLEAGQLLAELECKDVAIQYELARKEHTRAASLLKTSAGSQENYDKSKQAYDSAALHKEWCSVTSPLKGKVLYKYYEEGEFVAAGRKLFTVADMTEMDVWAYVPHDTLASLKINQNVKGYLPETKQYFDGHISVINDEAEFTPKNVQTKEERTRLVYGVKLKFKNTDYILKPGMTVEVEF